MTDKDIVKDLVKEVLLENPDLQRQQRIAEQRADLECFMKERSAPGREPTASAVDATNAPVRYEETVLPIQRLDFFTDPGQSAAPPASSSAPAFVYLDAMVCDDMDMDVVVRLMIAPPA